MAPKSTPSRPQTHSISDGGGPNQGSSTVSSWTARSHKSCITAASELTKPEFGDWANQVKIELPVKINLPSTASFNSIRTLQTNSKKFPRWLNNPKSNNYSFMPPAYKKWQDVLCSSLSTKKYEYVDSDEANSGFPFAIGIIFQICHHQARLHSHPASCTGLNSERDLRFILDSLMMHSCNGDGDEFLVYSTKQKLRLPATKSSGSSRKYNIGTTTADGISSRDILEFKPYTLRFQYREPMSAFATKSPTLHLILVHSVVEYKHNKIGKNQMKMGIVLALY